MRAIDNCKKYDVEFNTLTLLNAKNTEHPDEVFDFLTGLGVRFLQFIPCVEVDPETGKIADFSVTPKQYGDFLCRIFDRWYEHGPLDLSIRDFDSLLSYYVQGRHTICTFDQQCSQYIVIEHTGDAFPCDFFVEPKWRLGNIFETPIEKLAAGKKKRAFARAKRNLCNKCLRQGELLLRGLQAVPGSCRAQVHATGCRDQRTTSRSRPAARTVTCRGRLALESRVGCPRRQENEYFRMENRSWIP
ncbi:MAG: SPASM domain-containing protein [Planctomycetota bacterium]|jgi:radical SAM protein with 4Fe4S-binding SPASM domain